MTWLELSVRVPQEFVEPISYLFNRHGKGFSIEEPEADHAVLRTYVSSRAYRKLAQIDVGVRLVRTLVPGAELVTRELVQEDWETAWKEHFSLFRVGERLVIRPSWVDYDTSADELVITLDPGMAFGTGYHPTTRMCLLALEQLVTPGLSVLDIGTGSGVLAVAARLLGAVSAVGIDTDPNAVRVARENCRANGLGREVRLTRGTLPSPQVPAESFDLAVGNISARVIQEKAGHALEALRVGGSFVASGFIRDQTPDVIETLQNAGFDDIRVDYTDEWACLICRRA